MEQTRSAAAMNSRRPQPPMACDPDMPHDTPCSVYAYGELQFPDRIQEHSDADPAAAHDASRPVAARVSVRTGGLGALRFPALSHDSVFWACCLPAHNTRQRTSFACRQFFRPGLLTNAPALCEFAFVRCRVISVSHGARWCVEGASDDSSRSQPSVEAAMPCCICPPAKTHTTTVAPGTTAFSSAPFINRLPVTRVFHAG